MIYKKTILRSYLQGPRLGKTSKIPSLASKAPVSQQNFGEWGNVSFFNWNGGDCTVNRSSLQPFDTGMEVKTSKKNDQSYKCFPTVYLAF